jgi:endonuclease III
MIYNSKDIILTIYCKTMPIYLDTILSQNASDINTIKTCNNLDCNYNNFQNKKTAYDAQIETLRHI